MITQNIKYAAKVNFDFYKITVPGIKYCIRPQNAFKDIGT